MNFQNFLLGSALILGFYVDATRFVKCGVRLDEMVCLDDKVKVKRVVVPCVEVDIHGDEIEAST